MFIEMLESRDLLARVAWDGDAGNSLWSDPLNWDGNALPTAGDSVIIDAPGNIQVVYDLNNNLNLGELELFDNLRVSAGSIQVSGAFLLQNGNTLISDNAEFYALGSANIHSANLQSVNGGLIQLDQLNAYANQNNNDIDRYLSAIGAGSRINLPNLATISSVLDWADELRIEALNGGRIGRRLQRENTTVPLMQNRLFIHDVNDDDYLTAIDALVVINFLNRYGPQLNELSTFNIANANYLDVSGDGVVNAMDALQVINRLKRSPFTPSSEGEGEGEGEGDSFGYQAADHFFQNYSPLTSLKSLLPLDFDWDSNRKRPRR